MMRRLAYGLTFLVVLGLVTGALLSRPAATAGPAALISAAHAMEGAETIHARAWGEVGLPNTASGPLAHPGSSCGGGAMGGAPGSSEPEEQGASEPFWEYWYSPAGFRWDYHEQGGGVAYSFTGDVAAGRAWQYWPHRNLAVSYAIASDDLADFVEKARESFLDVDLRLNEIAERGHEWTTRTETWDGAEVLVVVEDLGIYLVSGRPMGTVEYYVDGSTGRLKGFRHYGAEWKGKPLIAETEIVEYGADISPVKFEYDVPADAEVIDGDFEVRSSGYIAFDGMGYAFDYDPRADWLIEEAYRVRHWAGTNRVTWSQVEEAYLAVLEEDPDNWDASLYLGRMYTRWGRFERALSLLPEKADVWDAWAWLNRAFCLDALGRRNEALDIYENLAQWGASCSIGAWAQLGLEKPTWPADLPIEPEPGEFRFTPTREWHASASDSAVYFGPESAIDGDRSTSWGTGGSPDKMQDGHHPGQWFKLVFDSPQRVSRVVLDHYGEKTFYTNNWARGLKAEVTLNGSTWEPVEVTAGGPRAPHTVRFDPPQEISGIRFEVAEKHLPEWWSIAEVFVFSRSQ